MTAHLEEFLISSSWPIKRTKWDKHTPPELVLLAEMGLVSECVPENLGVRLWYLTLAGGSMLQKLWEKRCGVLRTNLH